MKLAIFTEGVESPGTIETELQRAGHGFFWLSLRDLEQGASLDLTSVDLALLVRTSEDREADSLEHIRQHLPSALPLLITAPEHLGPVVKHLRPHGPPATPVHGPRPCRIRAAVGAGSEVLHCPPYRLDLSKTRAWIGGREPDLTPREFELAAFILKHPNQLLERERLLRAVWGYDETVVTRTLDTHISRLRSKLELTGRHGWTLRSVYQRGYRLECPGPDGCP